MIPLLLAILASTIIGVIFKFFDNFGIDNFQAVTFNYLACLLVGSLLNRSYPFTADVLQSEWFTYDLFLGLLFIAGFNFAAIAFQKFGIALTSVMQRMSLIITVGVTIIYFHESAPWVKLAGIALAIMAIFLVNRKSGRIIPDDKPPRIYYFFPLFVLVISALIEIILFYVEYTGILQGEHRQFTTHGFGIAAVFGLAVLIPGYAIGKFRFKWKHLLAGFILGVPNYFSIYLITLMLKEGIEASVGFPILNVSVLLLSAILAWKAFDEHLSRANWAGILCSMLAIILIALSSQ